MPYYNDGASADAALIQLAAAWEDAPKRHDLRPRVIQLAEQLMQLVPRAHTLNIDQRHVVCGAIWKLLEDTRAEREPAEQRALAAGRTNVIRELRNALDAIEKRPVPK